MATPIIDGVELSPPVVEPGGTTKVTIHAHDPDERIEQFTGRAMDSTGAISVDFTADVRISDPLTFELDVPEGFTVTPTAEPHVFIVTVPE